ALLSTYGIPSGVWLQPNPLTHLGFRQFFMGVYYLEQHFTAIFYDEVISSPNQGLIQGCFDENFARYNNPTLTLWSKDIQLSMQDINEFNSIPNQPNLEEAIGMDIETFYQTYKDPGKRPCVETPENLWPDP
ncbi:MAG: hypothetical protein N2C13_03785, partial [Chloroflexota bacterium]